MISEIEKKRCKILIVEDNAIFRQTLKGLLDTRFPFISFEEAWDGREALKKVNDFLPDLIFMDIKLPGESGLQLTKKIKNSYPEIIIIILTNYDLPEYREATKQKGADYFLTKGYSNIQEIMALVDSILSNLKKDKTKEFEGVNSKELS